MQKDEMLRFLPYLLQDLWELGSNPNDIIYLIKKHMTTSEKTQILDLACGKGAVVIRIVQNLNIWVKGIDIVPEFIAYAKQKANDMGVANRCVFATDDINRAVITEKGYDCVILGSAGDALGTPKETIEKLKLTVKSDGFVLLYDTYLLNAAQKKTLRYKEREYLTYENWLKIFSLLGLRVIEAVPNEKASDNDANNKLILNRAHELIRIYPDKETIFKDFVNYQLNGSYDLENSVAGITWLLKMQ